MNQFKTETNAVLIDDVPLFSSSLLALFHVLRQSLTNRRLAAKPVTHTTSEEK